MVEFFQNLFSWFIVKKDEIVLFFTSINVASFATAIVLFVKQVKSTNSNTNVLNTLSGLLVDTTKLSSNVDNTLSITNALSTKVDDLDERVTLSFELLQRKLDAILDVQAIVYSSIKDDEARKRIQSLITSAKLAETLTKTELHSQIEELKSLKQEIAEKASQVAELNTQVSSATEEKLTKRSVKKTTLRY